MALESIREFNDEFHLALDLRYPGELPCKNLDLEIGCGVGMHPLQYCAQNPARNLVAIEHTKNKFESFQRKLGRLGGLSNLTAVHANAISWITQNIETESIDNLFILYPNPYPKKRQANQRWHQMAFMKKLIECLKTDGQLVMATNMSFYANEARAYLTGVWGLEEVCFEKITKKSHPFFVPRTHFEQKYFDREETLYSLVLKKTCPAGFEPATLRLEI